MRLITNTAIVVLTLLALIGAGVAQTAWIQQNELTASDGNANDTFGYSVAVSGSTVVVGTPYHTVGSNTAQGAVYVFVLSGKTWVQQAELTASDGTANDQFGYSVAVTNNTVVVGARNRTVGSNQSQGAAYVFVRSGAKWTQQAELTASDGANGDSFGTSVGLSGSAVVLGAPNKTVGSTAYQGAAYVFVESGGTWSQQSELTSSDGAFGDQFGSSVGVSGSTVVVGAWDKAVGLNSIQGVAYVFVRSGTMWSQQAELTASDGVANDWFGWSVAVAGNTVVVASPCHKSSSGCPIQPGPGAAYVFVQSGGTWSQQAELTASDGAAGDYFGWSVAVTGSTVVVGAPNHNVGSKQLQGAAYVFQQSGTKWSQQGALIASDGGANDGFGDSVAISGSTIVAGADGHIVGGNILGAAYVFVPPATLTPASATYQAQKAGTTSTAKTFTLTNNQTVSLTSIAISTTGDFAVSGKTCGTSLAAESKCTVSVTFTPTTTGKRTGKLSVKDGASNSPQTVSLSGTGD